jgi:hypothetical protein
MKKEYIIGGLALVGAIAVIAYLNKPKRNSEGFFNATGVKGKGTLSKGNCAYCKTQSGNVYHTGESRTCAGGDFCSAKYSGIYS